ncbi:MAG TPA: hypothetical protein VKO84_07175 [Gaiellaceae bacterium]|nr:hypothetical protein [Gaiellaceae bacterium]
MLNRTAEDALPAKRRRLSGARARAYAVAAAVIVGLALGAATVPAQHRWVNLRQDHHDHRAARMSTVVHERAQTG